MESSGAGREARAKNAESAEESSFNDYSHISGMKKTSLGSISWILFNSLYGKKLNVNDNCNLKCAFFSLKR